MKDNGNTQNTIHLRGDEPMDRDVVIAADGIETDKKLADRRDSVACGSRCPTDDPQHIGQ